MKLYVMCVTPKSLIDVDRRVLNQCEIFQEQGWDVYLLIPSQQDLIEKYQTITLIEFNGHTRQNIDDWAKSFFKIDEKSTKKTYSVEITDALYQTDDHDVKNSLSYLRHQPPLGISNRYLYTDLFLDQLRIGKPDAVYCADYHGMIAARVFYEETNTPYVIDSHEYCLSHHNYDPKEQAIVRKIEEECFQYSKAIVTVSSIFAELYQIEYQLKQMPFVYYNAPKPVNQIKTFNIRSICQIPKEHKIILFHGGLPLVKRNLELLLQISPQLKKHQIHLLFVGYGPLVNKIKEFEYLKTVHYLNALPQDELAILVEQVDAIIVPYIALDINQKFCAPNRFFDALSSRTFVIANHSLEIIKSMIEKFKIGYTGPMHNQQTMLQTILDAFAYQETNSTFQDLDLIDSIFGFEAQKQTVFSISNVLKSFVQLKKQQDLKLYEFKNLLETEILKNIEKADYIKAREYCDRLKLLYPFDTSVLELEHLLSNIIG